MTENQLEPWKKRNGEPSRWFRRFERYCFMGTGRSIEAVYRAEIEAKLSKVKRPSWLWYEKSKIWEWSARAEAWDQHLIAEAEAKWRAEIMSETEVMARLSEQGRANIATFISQSPKAIKAGSGQDAETVWIESGTLDWDKVRELGHLIKKISFNQYGPVIELHSGLEALVKTGDALGIFVRKVDISSNGQPIARTLSDDELLRIAAGSSEGAAE